MNPYSKNIFFDEVQKDAVYVSGISGDLLKEFVNFFKDFNTSVFTEKDLSSSIRFTYVFQKDNLNNLVQNVRLAKDSGAKLILLISNAKEEEKIRIHKMMSQIHSGVEWYLVFIPKLHTQDETKLFVRTLFKKITSMKKEVISSSPSPIEKSQLKTNEIKDINQKNNNQKVKVKKNFKVPVFVTTVVTVIIFLSLYFGSIIGSVYFGINQLEKASVSYKNGNFKEATSHAQKAEKIFIFGEKLSAPVLAVGKSISYNDSKAIEDSFKAGRLTATTVVKALFVSQLGKQIGESVLSSRTSVPKSEFERITSEVEKLDTDIKHLTAQVEEIKNTDSRLFKYFNITPKVNEAEEYLTNINEVLHLSTRFAHIMPSLLGYDSPKTFLILFQNNAELRPTGGFIGSFGWVTFSQGRLMEFKTEDVYTADGQLKGHVAPPEPLKKYLAQENWYLRDSNFDPDFSISAQQAEWFLKHEMNLTFDGVIALDLQSVQEILRGMGGVYVSDYNQTITADNLFLEAQSKSELGFFPGSTQKRDYIGSLTRSMFIKMTSGDIEWGSLLSSVKKSLDEKHILIYLHDEDGQALVEEGGWGGRLAAISCSQENCISNYLMIVEANLGINKSNFLVSREVDLAINKKPGVLEHELNISYTNESKAQAYPGGQYFSYTRILLPKEVQIDSIKVGNEQVKKEEIATEIYQDKTMVGFPMAIPPSTQTDVNLKYYLPNISPLVGSMELLVQKQPGVVSYPINISLTGIENTTDVIGGATNATKQQTLVNDQVINFKL